MKKVFFTMVVLLMLCVAAKAQDKNKSFTIGAGSGITYFGNYSPLSLYADDTPDCLSKIGFSVDYHKYLNGMFYLGVEASVCGLHTSAIANKELAGLGNLSFAMGADVPLWRNAMGNGWEIPVEIKVGPTMMVNEIVYDGVRKDFYRWGAMGSFGFGLNYCGENFSIGLSNTAFVGGNFVNKVTLPDGMENNTENGSWFYGYRLMLNVAFVME